MEFGGFQRVSGKDPFGRSRSQPPGAGAGRAQRSAARRIGAISCCPPHRRERLMFL